MSYFIIKGIVIKIGTERFYVGLLFKRFEDNNMFWFIVKFIWSKNPLTIEHIKQLVKDLFGNYYLFISPSLRYLNNSIYKLVPKCADLPDVDLKLQDSQLYLLLRNQLFRAKDRTKYSEGIDHQPWHTIIDNIYFGIDFDLDEFS